MSNFDFLRTILYSNSSEIIQKAIKSLSNEGLEVYVRDKNNSFIISNENVMNHVDTIFVPAADWDDARIILEDIQLGDYICQCNPPEEFKNDLDIARDKFLKKRKWTYIETAVIIVLAMLYYCFKTFYR